MVARAAKRNCVSNTRVQLHMSGCADFNNTIDCRALRGAVGIEVVALLTRNSPFALLNIAFGAEEALVVFRKEDEARAPVGIVASVHASLDVVRILKASFGPSAVPPCPL